MTLYFAVFFGSQMTSPPFDLFNYRLTKQVKNAYKNPFFKGKTQIAVSIEVLKPATCSSYIVVMCIKPRISYLLKDLPLYAFLRCDKTPPSLRKQNTSELFSNQKGCVLITVTVL